VAILYQIRWLVRFANEFGEHNVAFVDETKSPRKSERTLNALSTLGVKLITFSSSPMQAEQFQERRIFRPFFLFVPFAVFFMQAAASSNLSEPSVSETRVAMNRVITAWAFGAVFVQTFNGAVYASFARQLGASKARSGFWQAWRR
jgi:hypothetical protein